MQLTADLLKPGLPYLPAIAGWIGGIAVVASLGALAFSDVAMAQLRRFPRSVWPGRVIATVSLAWAACWLYVMPLGPIPLPSGIASGPAVLAWKPLLPYLVPVAAVAVSVCLDELLSCRAMGGLMVLLPTPMLTAAQWSPSAWRFVVIAIAYGLAIFGMFVIAQPYLLRDLIAWSTRSRQRFAALAAAKLATGVLLIVLALAVF
ncbi:MAG: hypothetical protein FWF84_01825 [Kiritimatiellaeota bacterium]|nr:hypothetical protein [Kiritimatiellota bacterium]